MFWFIGLCAFLYFVCPAILRSAYRDGWMHDLMPNCAYVLDCVQQVETQPASVLPPGMAMLDMETGEVLMEAAPAQNVAQMDDSEWEHHMWNVEFGEWRKTWEK